MRKVMQGAVLATALVLATTGLVRSEEIGRNLLWVQPMRDHPVHKLMQAGFLNECKKLGYSCEITGNPSATSYDVAASIPLAEAALSRTKYGCVAVYGPDPSIFPFIGKLAKEGYPVVTWHVMPAEGTVKGLVAATGEDVAEAGANAAEATGAKLGGKGTVAVTQGSFNLIENTMAASFKKALNAKYPSIKVLDPQVEGFEPSAAKAKAVSILQGNPDVTGAFSTTGNGSETWSGAARTAGRKVVVIAMDYVRQNLDLVKSGEAYGLVAQPLYEEGQKAAELCAELAQGKSVPYRNVLPAKVITANDLAPYYAVLQSAGQ
jgi:ribose transport system substrate-binding protein